jgi:hypothetical protein
VRPPAPKDEARGKRSLVGWERPVTLLVEEATSTTHWWPKSGKHYVEATRKGCRQGVEAEQEVVR